RGRGARAGARTRSCRPRAPPHAARDGLALAASVPAYGVRDTLSDPRTMARVSARIRARGVVAWNVVVGRGMRTPHPLDHQPAFRAAVSAAPPLAELVTRIGSSSLVGTL